MAAYGYEYSVGSNVEIRPTIWPAEGFHSASVAMMPHWPFAGLRVLDEMMAFEIGYHHRR